MKANINKLEHHEKKIIKLQFELNTLNCESGLIIDKIKALKLRIRKEKEYIKTL